MPEKGQKYILEVADPVATDASAPDDADYTKVGYTQSKTLTRSVETIDTSSDESPDYTTAIPGMESFTFEGEALYVYDDAGQTAIEDAKDAQDSSTLPWLRLTSNVTGGYEYAGQVIITELTIEISTNEVITYSISTEGVGAISRTQISS